MRYILPISILFTLVPLTALADGPAPPAPYAMDTFPARAIDMCPYVDESVERPAAGGAWTYAGSSGGEEWVTCDQVPKGADGSAFAKLLIGTSEEGWKLVQDPRPPVVQMHGLTPFHTKLLWAIGPKAKRQTTDWCAEGKPATAVVCEGMIDSPASDYVTWVRKMEASLRQAQYWVAKDPAKARAALETMDVDKNLRLTGVQADAKVKTSEKGLQSVEEFRKRHVAVLDGGIKVYDQLAKAP